MADPKDIPRLVYSEDRPLIISLARKVGKTNTQILESLCANEFGAKAKRDIVCDWAKDLGLSQADALDLAIKAAIIKR